MYGQRGEAEQLYKAYAAALALHSQALDTNSIAFVSMGTGVYKWPMALAADVAVKALLSCASSSEIKLPSKGSLSQLVMINAVIANITKLQNRYFFIYKVL